MQNLEFDLYEGFALCVSRANHDIKHRTQTHGFDQHEAVNALWIL